MRNPLRFFVELLRQPRWVPIWVAYLMVINVASASFVEEPLAKLILAAFVISAVAMMALYSRFGFEKILGLGHVLWVPLLVSILARIPESGGTFQGYLILLALSIAVSLAFDTVDVWTWFQRRRKN